MDKSYFRYYNQKCPICGKEFSENDDIVVCPVCGTPHHRSCYAENGKCGNAHLHGDFRWTRENDKNAVSEPVQGSGDGQPVQEQPFSPFGNNKQQFNERTAPNPLKLFPYELDSGVTTEETANFVQLNAFRYIEHFFHQKSGKRTWNWGAFFFAPYWFFYRKLYKLGAIFLAVSLLLSTAVSLIPASARITADVQQSYNNYLENDNGNAEEQYVAEVQEIIQGNTAGAAIISGYFVALVAMHIAAALIANKRYYEYTVKSIRELKLGEKNSETLMLKIFKKGGVALGSVMLAVLVNQCVVMLTAILLSAFK